MTSLFDALRGPDPISQLHRPNKKLTPAEVEEIRKRWKASDRPVQKVLAEEFGVTQPQISKIVNGLQWAQEKEER